jgi:DNA repair protein RadD
MLQLRPYQTRLIDGIRAEWKAGKRRILAVAPTGSGKTCFAAHIISSTVKANKRAWFVVHRRELVRQSVDTLEQSAGVDCGVIASGFGSNSFHLAQVASIQTLIKRISSYDLPHILILDEAHHVVSSSWTAMVNSILHKSPKTIVIGLTATPQRLDGRGLGRWGKEAGFECIVEGPSVSELIQEGHLASYKLWAAKPPDLTGVHNVAGDYNKTQLSAALSRTTVVGDAVDEYKRHCMGRRALAFTWSVESSKLLVERFRMEGIAAAHVDGDTSDAERDTSVALFKSGHIQVLSNVDLFGEGFDVPSAEAAFLMRPTQSLGMYMQQCGRVLRPGKPFAMIFDHAGHIVRHGYPDDPRKWDLEGSDGSKKKQQASPVRQCMKCYATLPVWTRSCKWCGYTFEVKPRTVKTEEGQLVQIDKAERVEVSHRDFAQERAGARTVDELLMIEKRRGYRPGWAQHVAEAREKKGRI